MAFGITGPLILTSFPARSVGEVEGHPSGHRGEKFPHILSVVIRHRQRDQRYIKV